ncbi:hypothetical protein FSP39_002895 [Pinctada imbricata]|uniref:Tyrosinase copper-binding domain-containing protein n=1 Tax=Pinctada imbricata TaxID=66713 RepID=A0AA88Y245_PINIB|nr:hypothetical protein FSP39_002895 [Pinctada imbricata]
MYRLIFISLLSILFIFESGKGQQDYSTPTDNIHNCTLPDSNSFNIEDLDPNCLEYFNIHAIKKRSENKLTKSQFNYIQSLIREGAGILKTSERDKRQIRFQKRRVYDMFADYHAIPSIEAIIHRGPNFLGWHRVYLF